MKRDERYNKNSNKFEAAGRNGESPKARLGLLSSPNIPAGVPFFELIQMDRGYFKIWRRLREHPIWRDNFCLLIFLYCLNHAEWKDGRKIIVSKKEFVLGRGQLSTGRRQIAKEMNIPESTVSHCLKRLCETYEIMNITPNRKFSIITILNWDRYQFVDKEDEPQKEPLVNHRRTTGEPLVNTPEEVKNIRIKELKNKAIPQSFKTENKNHEPPKYCHTCEKYFHDINKFEKHLVNCRLEVIK